MYIKKYSYPYFYAYLYALRFPVEYTGATLWPILKQSLKHWTPAAAQIYMCKFLCSDINELIKADYFAIEERLSDGSKNTSPVIIISLHSLNLLYSIFDTTIGRPIWTFVGTVKIVTLYCGSSLTMTSDK